MTARKARAGKCGREDAEDAAKTPAKTPAKRNLLVYGANGYTGRLIVEAALRAGLAPVVAGRRREVVEPLAAGWGLNSLCFSLEDVGSAGRLLEPYAAMLLAAGPFSKTSAPALEACLAARTAYLDITGEVDVFESVFARDADAKAAGVAVLPGTGFDVVPSDCLAEGALGGPAGGGNPHARVSRLQDERGHAEDDARGHPEGRARAPRQASSRACPRPGRRWRSCSGTGPASR